MIIFVIVGVCIILAFAWSFGIEKLDNETHNPWQEYLERFNRYK